MHKVLRDTGALPHKANSSVYGQISIEQNY